VGRRDPKWLALQNAATLVLVGSTVLSIAEACFSRSTPKPRPPVPTALPNITFHTFPCPPAYNTWYCLLHSQDSRLLALQLCRGLYRTDMRIQRPGRFLYAVKATQHVPDSKHSSWRHNSSVLACHRVCSRVYSLATERERDSSQLCGR
jgi:hypothetical protein